MPGFDGTGPFGQGPMTGQGRGYCILKTSGKGAGEVKGFVGLQGAPVGQKVEDFKNTGKEVIDMPAGDGTGPGGMGPMTGRAAGFCAGFPVPGYMNRLAGRAGFYGVAAPIARPYGTGSYGYGSGYRMPYSGWVNPWVGRGFGFRRVFGRGRGLGRGRGRFGFWW